MKGGLIMPKPKNQPETNVEFVTRIMEFSNYGALALLFVLEAIRNHRPYRLGQTQYAARSHRRPRD
jgi:hypothetical protein